MQRDACDDRGTETKAWPLRDTHGKDSWLGGALLPRNLLSVGGFGGYREVLGATQQLPFRSPLPQTKGHRTEPEPPKLWPRSDWQLEAPGGLQHDCM